MPMYMSRSEIPGMSTTPTIYASPGHGGASVAPFAWLHSRQFTHDQTPHRFAGPPAPKGAALDLSPKTPPEPAKGRRSFSAPPLNLGRRHPALHPEQFGNVIERAQPRPQLPPRATPRGELPPARPPQRQLELGPGPRVPSPMSPSQFAATSF